jgi:hypothetical protein
MSLLMLVVVLLAVILALWLVGLAGSLPGADPQFIRAARFLILLIALLYVCQQVGLFDLLAEVRFRV